MWNWNGKYNILRVADLSRHEWNAIEWNAVHSLIYCLNEEKKKIISSVLTRCYVSYTSTLVCRPLCPPYLMDGNSEGWRVCDSITRAGIWRMWIFLRFTFAFRSNWKTRKINKFLAEAFHGNQKPFKGKVLNVVRNVLSIHLIFRN